MNVLHESLVERLRCASCKGPLARNARSVNCKACGAKFPVVHEVPVMVDESKSMFRVCDCIATAEKAEEHPQTLTDKVRDTAEKIMPKAGMNLAGQENLRYLAARLREETDSPRVLVLGGGSLGVGIKAIVDDPKFTVVESDIVFGPRTNLVCDAHDVPFADGTFDAVIAQAVFEYMIDPFHVAEEIHRVLKPKGWVYAESPFMQQVHGGAYDFFRFTHVGHRCVFRKFEEDKSGVVCGPGMALSWAYRYFLRSFAKGRTARVLSNAVGNLTSFWFSRLDKRVDKNPGAYDAASAFYFLGRRSEKALSNREILEAYRGSWKMHR